MSTHLLILSFDSRGILQKNPQEMRAKLARDGITKSAQKISIISIKEGADKAVYDIDTHINGRHVSEKPLKELQYTKEICAATEAMKDAPTHILIYHPRLIFAAKALKKKYNAKLIWYMTNIPEHLAAQGSFGYLKKTYYKLLQQHLIAASDAYAVINKTTKAYLVARGVPEAKIQVIPPKMLPEDDVIKERAPHGIYRKTYNIAEEDTLIISVSRLEPEKNIQGLIKAVAALSDPSIHLLIAGDGSLRNALQKEINTRSTQSTILLLGHLDREALWSLYKDADAAMLLSHTEALGIALWEAMEAKVPVIGAPIEGIKESIGEAETRGFFWNEEASIKALRDILRSCKEKSGDTLQKIEKAYTYVTKKRSSQTLILP